MEKLYQYQKEANLEEFKKKNEFLLLDCFLMNY